MNRNEQYMSAKEIQSWEEEIKIRLQILIIIAT